MGGLGKGGRGAGRQGAPEGVALGLGLALAVLVAVSLLDTERAAVRAGSRTPVGEHSLPCQECPQRSHVHTLREGIWQETVSSGQSRLLLKGLTG